MAFMMALVALSIDAMLPALPQIGADLGVRHENDNQLMISVLFLGLALGQMIYGPLSDALGRKPSVYLGFFLFFIGCGFSIFAQTLQIMLIGRLLQGLGLAGPRVVSIALIRDQYEGNAMARVMSFVMSVFIFVPAVAPSLGQVILWVGTWRSIFSAFLGLGVIIFIWFAARQPETLSSDARIPFSIQGVLGAIREICSNRISLGYTLAAGFISSAFLAYLSTAQQIFQQQYEQGDLFPLYFGVLALFIGSASFLNGKLVMRTGMVLMSNRAAAALTLWSVAFSLISLSSGSPMPLWLFMVYLCTALFFVGILFGNLNALAMEPLGHIAGIGAAVVGSLVTFLSIPFGVGIGQAYNGTVFPLILGFAACAGLAWWLMIWAQRPPKTASLAQNAD